MSAKYDIVLFGVTGFTGKLVAEYLFEKNYGAKWAVSARNQAKAEGVLSELSSKFSAETPDVLVADLICTTEEQEGKLREIVKQTKVVLTCSGPFEKYSQTLVKLCAEEGVSYADITGETDYFRQTIEKHDKKAQETGAVLVCHCGQDCVPVDLMVYELHQFAKTKGCELSEVMTYEEFAEDAAFSGGTISTASYQLSKDRTKSKTSFDPLFTTPAGEKSGYLTKNITPKSVIDVPGLEGRKAGPWVMAPVMVNCVKRSNALLGYSKSLRCGDVALKGQSWSAWLNGTIQVLTVLAAAKAPSVFGPLLPKAGEGPPRENMENGFAKVYAKATMVSEGKEERKLDGLFQFNKDTAYLYTAAMLVETGMLLVEKHGAIAGGCKSPAAALGADLTQRILKEMDTSLEIKEV